MAEGHSDEYGARPLRQAIVRWEELAGDRGGRPQPDKEEWGAHSKTGQTHTHTPPVHRTTHTSTRPHSRPVYHTADTPPHAPAPPAPHPRLVDDPLSDAVLHRKFGAGVALVLGLNSDGAVTVRTEAEEAEAAAAEAGDDLEQQHRRLAKATLAQHPSGVDGGILVSVGADADHGSGSASGSEGGSNGERSMSRERVVLTATFEEN